LRKVSFSSENTVKKRDFRCETTLQEGWKRLIFVPEISILSLIEKHYEKRTTIAEGFFG